MFDRAGLHHGARMGDFAGMGDSAGVVHRATNVDASTDVHAPADESDFSVDSAARRSKASSSDRNSAFTANIHDDGSVDSAHFGDKVYDSVIPRNVRVAEAPSFGKPALIYDLKCAGSQAYLRLAKEVVKRERQRLKLAA